MYLRAAGFAVVTLCASAASLSAARFGDFLYETQFGEAIITGYDGPGGLVIFPTWIDNQLVTEIGVGALANNVSITGVELPDNLLFIRDQAFRNCTSLTRVSIPGEVLEVGEEAFRGCSSLREARFNEGVSLLLESAFADCALQRVALPASIDFIDPDVFAGNNDLAGVYFLGDAPTLGSNALGSAATAFFFNERVGFTSPSWDYAPGSSISSHNLGELDRVTRWLLTVYVNDADFLEHPERAPQPLAISYAFWKAPGSVFSLDYELINNGTALQITYFANRDGVSYQPLVSNDLIEWDSDSVVIGPMDSLGNRTATVPYHGEPLFFNVQVTVSQ